MPTLYPQPSRRKVLTGAVAFAAGAVGTLPAFSKAPMLGTQAPAYYRFKIGAMEATIVSDGPLALGEPKAETFPGVSQEILNKTLTDHFLPAKNISLEQNALVLNTGDKLVLFDTGLGTAKMFGPTTGRLIANLKAAGIEPVDIDAVVLSHAHPDHCWGLMNGGTRLFPSAQIYLSQADYDFWTDPTKAKGPMADMLKQLIAGTRGQLLPNRERIRHVKDGQEVLPGIQAIAAPGHTVGHTAYMLTSGTESFCYVADLAHHHVLVMERPKIEFVFDTDGKQAVASRIKMFDMLAAQRIAMLAYHFPWPGIGHIAKQGDGYRFVPTPMNTAL